MTFSQQDHGGSRLLQKRSGHSANGNEVGMRRGSSSLKGFYLGMQEKVASQRNITTSAPLSKEDLVLQSMIKDAEMLNRSTHSFKGFYLGMPEKVVSQRNISTNDATPLSKEESILQSIKEPQTANHLHKRLSDMVQDGSGTIDMEEFIEAYQAAKPGMSREALEDIFREADADDNGAIDYQEFVDVLQMTEVQVIRTLVSGFRFSTR
jgi:hypothetical protein